MQIRIAYPEDIKFIEGAYEHARAFMQANGNATQWPDGYHGRIDAEEDIARGHCFLVSDDEGPLAVFSSCSNTRITTRSPNGLIIVCSSSYHSFPSSLLALKFYEC